MYTGAMRIVLYPIFGAQEVFPVEEHTDDKEVISHSGKESQRMWRYHLYHCAIQYTCSYLPVCRSGGDD
jgi:hypothetical protein